MPTVSVERDELFRHMGGGRTYTDEEFDELCFAFGIELDDVTSERQEAQKTSSSSAKELEALSDTVIYKIDVPANRYDLLCVEGLARALSIFLGDAQAPVYQVTSPPAAESLISMTVRQSHTDTIRPFVVCAVLREVTFTEQRYESFIELQDQLHRNLCRQRTLVAIGTHDLDTIQPPFVYDARPPSAIEFVPLTPDDRGAFTADKLLEFYNTDPSAKHLKPYVPIIQDSPLYPVIVDANNVVLSLPPIINGSKSKLTLQTKNVFIECTATDLTKANIVLDTVCSMFSEYCAQPFTVEAVPVRYECSEPTATGVRASYVTPQMFTRTERASVAFCNSMIGIQLSAADMQALCNKVQLGPACLLENDTVLEVTVPPTRSDILHAVDIAEDVGIAYGYNNIVKRIPKTNTVGGEVPLHQLCDLLRDEIAHAGYVEVLTHGLCSWHDNFTALRRPVGEAVSLSNPANIEYQVVRTTLLPGLLKTLQHNKSASFSQGFKLFEISDVVVPDAERVATESIVGARNERRVCAVYAGPTSGFEIIHGLVDRIMTLTEVAPEHEYAKNSGDKEEEKYRVTRDGWYYTIAELSGDDNSDNNNKDDDDAEAFTYFPGRAAQVLVTPPGPTKHKIRIGTFGMIHPEVLANFDILYPASCMELNLEAIM